MEKEEDAKEEAVVSEEGGKVAMEAMEKEERTIRHKVTGKDSEIIAKNLEVTSSV